jgi:phosphatidylglycerol lysyltransferase
MTTQPNIATNHTTIPVVLTPTREVLSPVGSPVAPREKAERNSPTYWTQHQTSDSPGSISLEHRWHLLQQYGNFSIAYSTAVQPHLEYFGDEQGYIAFRRRKGWTFALGDPVCEPARRRDLISRFLTKYRRPSFVQVGRETASDLASLGFWVNEMGLDTQLPLAEYNFAGKEKEWLRYADNWIQKRGYRIAEGSLVAQEADIAEISEQWRGTRQIKRKEVRFLNRPIVMADEPGVRRFFLYDAQGRMEAFVFFDPLYSKGEISGYVTCIKRRRPETSQYAEPAIMKRAIETFQKERIGSVWLGLSPLADIENREFRANRWLHWTSRYYHSAGWINKYYYNFLGHTQYKKRFRGLEHQTYYASPVRFNEIRLLTLASLCGAF